MTYKVKDHHQDKYVLYNKEQQKKKNWRKQEEEFELLFLCPFIKNLSVVEIMRNQRKYIIYNIHHVFTP